MYEILSKMIIHLNYVLLNFLFSIIKFETNLLIG